MRSLGPDVVVEWGFLPIFANRIRQLATVGIEHWWFRADEPLAHEQYLQRDGAVLPDNYRVQVEQIESNWPVIERAFRGRILDVLTSDGTRMPNDAILARIQEAVDGTS